LHHAKHDRLIFGVAISKPLPFAADVGFINLDLAGQRKFAVNFRHMLSDLMSNAKRAFVGYAKLPLQFFARDAMPRSGEQIHRIEPQLQRRPAIFKQRTDSRVKMMSATLARIGALRFDAMPLGFLFAFRAGIILAKAHFKEMIQAGFIVAKLREKFPDCHAVFVAVVFHAHTL